MMKKLLILLLGLTMAGPALADIQDPPAAQYDAQRKLARGLANMTMGWSEVPYSVVQANKRDGNIAAFWEGGTRGVYRTTARVFLGLYEVVTFPLPTTKGDYRPPYKLEYMSRYKGWNEFPPQVGANVEYNYCRDYNDLNAP
jgi:putative exosortase-associated protein (TIGR04073 family)